MTLKSRIRRVTAGALLMLAVMATPANSSPAAAAPRVDAATSAPGHPLVLAHYYIWFDRASWNRAKRDYPLAGRYSSDDASIMRLQIKEAKSAGIDGFIVSWKNTPLLNSRLRTLISVARIERFKLAITYQGLTFDRVNLPANRVAADLDVFLHDFAGSPVFRIFAKPLLMLTGTPGMTKQDIETITNGRRDKLTILATEKNVAGYTRIAPLVDGDLYYWSSVNPRTYRNFAAKLAAMGEAVRAHNGIWIAPAAPGFDARMVGGKSVVDRADGATLRTEWSAAVTSLPDAIGIISWNEYSENTHIEPSRRYGDTYINQLRALTGANSPTVQDVDSSSPPGAVSPWRPGLIFGGAAALLALCSVVAVRRRRMPS